MKKALLVLGLVLLLALPAMAEEASISDLISKLPVTNAGVYYNINDSKFEFTSTFTALTYKDFNLNIGYATPESLVAGIGYQIVKLEDIGIGIPILKDLIVDAGWTVGWEEPLNDREFNNGPSVTFSWKW